MSRVTMRDAEREIANHREFTAGDGTLTGTEGATGTGRLPVEWQRLYREQDVVYTVRSYATPIAWVCSDGTPVIPDTKYSMTTSRHQNIARRALDAADIITSLA